MDEFEQQINQAVTQIGLLEQATLRALPKGAAAGARLLLADAQRRVPRRTGTLADSGFEAPVESDRSVATHQVGFRAFYARPVDRGHPVKREGTIVGRAAPVKFLSGPALSGRRGRIARAVLDTVQAEVRREMARSGL